MLDKELNFVVDNFDENMKTKLGIKSTQTDLSPKNMLPKNIFLVDNRPENIYHNINKKN